ncbi:MAG TPA: transcriptional repressor [Nitrospirota bacterium]|nr:transcriptional repressor [Nitrospirota bacterium]
MLKNLSVLAKYRNLGFKLTPQRIAILNYLEGNNRHPSAEDIHRAVAKKFPTLSLATVYTTLGALKEKGRVLELTIDPGKKRYDPETAKHNHLICVSCKKIIDIPASNPIDFPEASRQDFSIIESHVQYYGHCPECKNHNVNN